MGRTPWSAADPPVGFAFLGENSAAPEALPYVTFYRRRLPHVYATERSVFLTWRLHDSLPCHRAFPAETLTSGQAFAAMDRLLDETRAGRFCLRQPAVADMLVEAIQYIEQNPVRAGLVRDASDYRWSSAARATGGSPADQGVRPTASHELSALPELK